MDMVDDDGSTIEETLARIAPRGSNLECGNLLPLSRTQLTTQLKLSPRRYHVFARPPESGQWIYIAAIHRKPDTISVVAGLIESGLAVEAEVAVIAQSPGPRAGRVLIVYRDAVPHVAPCKLEDS
jgi:hypothetical protein